MQSLIKDINLAAEGRKKIDWVSNFMPRNKPSKVKPSLYLFT